MKAFSNGKKIRWGIIGCGAVTEVKSGPAYQKTAGFELSAVMRRDLDLAKDYAQRHQVANYSNDALALINTPDIDAIYIATPPDSHKYYGLLVAKAGKPCCIEKPLAPSYQDSLAICQAFKTHDVPLFVAYYRRSLPRFTHIKSLIDRQVIGDIRHVSWHLSKPPSTEDLSSGYNWRTDSHIARGGYFDDLASHGLDLICFLLGDVKVVKGIATNQQGLYGAYDAITANWQHCSGVTGVGSWNFGACSRQDDVIIYGSKGELRFSVFDEQPLIITVNNKQQTLTIEHPENIQLYHVENIKKQLVDGIEHPSIADTALHTSWIMEKILKGG
jgi:predicted dehydrogenase